MSAELDLTWSLWPVTEEFCFLSLGLKRHEYGDGSSVYVFLNISVSLFIFVSSANSHQVSQQLR